MAHSTEARQAMTAGRYNLTPIADSVAGQSPDRTGDEYISDGGATQGQSQSGHPIEKLLSLWYQARGDKGYVERTEIDAQAVGDIWPNCFLIDYNRRDGCLIFSQVGRLPRSTVPGADPARDGAMLLEWISDLARKVFTGGGPIVRNEFFPCEADGAEYGCVVLPLTDDFGVIKSVIGFIDSTDRGAGGDFRVQE